MLRRIFLSPRSRRLVDAKSQIPFELESKLLKQDCIGEYSTERYVTKGDTRRSDYSPFRFQCLGGPGTSTV